MAPLNKKYYSALVLTGSSPRHLFFVSTLSKYFKISAYVSESKVEYSKVSDLPDSLTNEHYIQLRSYENKYFFKNKIELNKFQNLKVNNGEINEERVFNWTQGFDYDFIAVFGSSMLKDIWFSDQSKTIVNLHLGLSPFYRGSATLFWPFFNNDLKHLGTTIHIIDKGIDTGPIIKTVKLKRIGQKNYYKITNRLIKKSIKQFPIIVSKYLRGIIDPTPQDKNKHIFYYEKSDLTSFHLRKVLSKYGE